MTPPCVIGGACAPQEGPSAQRGHSGLPVGQDDRGVGGEQRGYDGGKKIKGRKRHLLVDTQGLVLEVRVHSAKVMDRDGIKLLLEPSSSDRLHAVEPQEGRRDQALALGAKAAHASGEEARDALEGPTGGLGVDLVIDAVGAEVTRRMALDLLRPGGRAVFIGLHDDDSTLGFHGVVRGQIDLQGSYAYTAEDFEQALSWLVEGRAGIGELPPVLALEEGPGAFADLVRGPSAQIKVFLSGSGS